MLYVKALSWEAELAESPGGSGVLSVGGFSLSERVA